MKLLLYLTRPITIKVCDFDLKSGIRASKTDTYTSVDVGFYKGKLFHVSFKNKD